MRLIFIRQKLTNNYVMMFHSDDEGAPLKLDHSAEGTRRLLDTSQLGHSN